MLEFRILGPLEVVAEHGPIPLGGPKQRATLAILLLHRNHVLSVDGLADDLYSGAPPITAVTQVQRQIATGDLICCKRPSTARIPCRDGVDICGPSIAYLTS
jgi:DNA-binding SARP family transcriptional activator